MTSPQQVTDGIGRTVSLDAPPERIVSLVPSTTETLAAWGLGARVVGRTRYCVHPQPWVLSVADVGGTKNPRVDAIAALTPDLIVGNQEENRPALWPELERVSTVYVAYPRTVDEALDDLRRMSVLVGAADQGTAWAHRIEAARREARARAVPFRYVYLIWREPWMTISDDTFVASMLGSVGGRNAFGDRSERYPAVTSAEIEAAQPEWIFLSTEPYAFEARHAAELGALAPRCRLIDGELTSWHGVRMAAAFPYLAALVQRRDDDR